MPTPVVYNDLLYTCSNQGVLTAYNADSGERLYQERLGGKGGAFTASPVASDGKLYLSSEDGDVFVVKAGPKYELLSTNHVGEVMMASPAISDGLLIVRALNHVFAFGEAVLPQLVEEGQGSRFVAPDRQDQGDAIGAASFLRPHAERPGQSRTACKPEKVAPSHGPYPEG